MNHDRHSHYFLVFCLVASIVLVYFVIKPFLTPLILAAVFAFLFQPVYKKFSTLTRGSSSMSALATTIVAGIVVLVPLTFLGALILKESTELYQTLAVEDGSVLIEMAEGWVERAREVLPGTVALELNISQYARQALAVLAVNLGSIFSSLAKILLATFVFLAASYFFLKDGHKLRDYLVALSPLRDSDDKMIITRLESSVSATIKGSLTVGLIQGVLTGIGFAIFGVPNAALWGCVAAIMALVPGVGTALVILPATIFLFVTGNTFGAVGLLVWGVTAVGLVDNFLGPKLVGKGMQLHPLAVFLSVLGGLAFFGPLGFLLGPLAISICMTLVSIYSSVNARS